MIDILEPFIAPLQVALPAELKTALDQEDARTSGRRRDMEDSDQDDEDANVEGRGRGHSGRSRERRRSRSRDSRRDPRSRGSRLAPAMRTIQYHQKSCPAEQATTQSPSGRSE